MVYADAGYTGIEKRDEVKDDENLNHIVWLVAKRRGSLRKMDESLAKELLLAEEYAKSSLHSRVEHAFHYVKKLFGS